MPEDPLAPLIGIVGVLWTIFTIAFPIIVLIALYSLHKAVEQLIRMHTQTATQVAALVRMATQPSPDPASPSDGSSDEPTAVPLPAEGSVLQQLLADPTVYADAREMRRIYGWPVALSVVKRAATKRGLDASQVSEAELRAALLADQQAVTDPPAAPSGPAQ